MANKGCGTFSLLMKLLSSPSVINNPSSSNILSSSYSQTQVTQTTASLTSSPSNLLPVIIMLGSVLGLFNKSRVLSASPPASNYYKDLFQVMREMLLAKGREILFSSYFHFEDELGITYDKDRDKKMERSQKESLDETNDIRLKSLIALISLAEKKGWEK
jgi:hypothetical protein